MTLAECYEKFNGDYKAVMSQLGSESLVERFLLKFPAEKTMDRLRECVAAGDISESFRAAHTLKGVAINLALKSLVDAVSELTEQLRPQTEPADAVLFHNVEECYKLIIDTIAEFSASKQ